MDFGSVGSQMNFMEPRSSLQTPPTDPPVPGHPTFNPRINGLRGLSALFVFVYHVHNAGIVEWNAHSLPALTAIFAVGTLKYGVEIFFMISGYVIVGSLRRHASPGSFYVDRIIRTYALWLPFCIGIALVAPWIGWKAYAGVGVGEWTFLTIGNLFLLPPVLPMPMVHPAAWSLSYEWLFYLSAGMFSLGFMKFRYAVCVGCALLVVVAALLVPRALFFFPGVLVYFAVERLQKHGRLLRMPIVSMAVFLAAWGLTESDDASPAHDIGRWQDPWHGLWVLLALLASLHMFASIVLRRGVMARFLETRVMQFMGDISFSFYLFSGIAMYAVKKAVYFFFGTAFDSTNLLILFALLSLLLSIGGSVFLRQTLEVRLARAARNFWRKRMSRRVAIDSSESVPDSKPMQAELLGQIVELADEREMSNAGA